MNRHAAKAAKGSGSREPGACVDALARVTLDAAFEVHRRLGPGFLEAVYEQALAIELGLRGIAFERQLAIAVKYKGHSVGEARLDLLVARELIVEIKAVEQLVPVHMAQVISYLRATALPLALLITFNVAQLRLGIRRVVLCSQPQVLGDLGGVAVPLAPRLSEPDAVDPTSPKLTEAQSDPGADAR